MMIRLVITAEAGSASATNLVVVPRRRQARRIASETASRLAMLPSATASRAGLDRVALDPVPPSGNGGQFDHLDRRRRDVDTDQGRALGLKG